MPDKHFLSFALFACILLSCAPKQPIRPDSGTASTSKAPAEPVYVPENLEDAHRQLSKILPFNVIEEMRQGTEDDMVRYHHGLGTWIRNNWGLWRGGRLADYFRDLGIHHPDDMSGIILDTFWCHLNGQPFRLEERIAYYQAYWKAHQHPENHTCPTDGLPVEITRTLVEDSLQGKYLRAIHAGRCKKGHWWAYETGKGWYEPDEGLLKRIKSKDGITRIK